MQLAVERPECDNDVFQHLFFTAQFLGAFVVIPDRRVFRQSCQFIQTRLLGIEVKDTSAALPFDCRGRRVGEQWR